MKQMAKTMIAGFIAVAMIFTLTPLVGGFVFANDDDGEDDSPQVLDKIAFDGDDDYGWYYNIPLDNPDDQITLDDLNITVLDEDGDEIDSDEYELTLYKEGEAVEGSFGIANEDKHTTDNDGCGFTSYDLVAEPAEDSNCEGSAEAEICVVDSLSLNWICVEKGFNSYTKQGGWRQADWYWLSLDDLEDGTTITTINGDDLEEGTDYTVTYYERTEDPTNDPNQDREAVLTPNDENKLNGRPTQAGGYLAVFEAKDGNTDGYYGGDVVLLDVGDFIGISPIQEGDDLWSDEDRDYELNLTKTGTLDIYVGVRNETGTDWSLLLNDDENSDQYFEYDEDLMTLTLHGDKIYERVGEETWIQIYATITSDGTVVADGFADVNLRHTEYSGFPQDEDMLVGQGRTIDQCYYVGVRNANFPDWKYFSAYVTDVASSNEDVVSVNYSTENDCWDLRAKEVFL